MTQIPPPAGSLWARPVDPNIHPDDIKRISGQNRRVLELLAKGVTLTPDNARTIGVTRLAARINDLRNHGFKIIGKRDPVTKCSAYWMEVAT